MTIIRRKRSLSRSKKSSRTSNGTASSGYFATSPDAIQKKLAELKGKSKGDGGFWTAKVGKNTLRVLPPWNKEGVFYHDSIIHFGIGPNKKSAVCISDSEKGCPVCNLVQKYSEDVDDQKKAKAKDMSARNRVLLNVIDRENEAQGIQIWATSEQNLGKLLTFFADPEWGDFTHPEEGFDVIIERTGTGKTDTRYDLRLTRKPSPIGMKGWQTKMNKLDEVFKRKKRSEIIDIIKGRTSEPGE
jgi:hypothetical protein